ncbi:hypothetical protein FRB94_006712 [Tulasnella sp. JGI-2019a]|nr:hypothetical protein FRB94_006712 [Tulasnella sp. JGI-2019a]KAG9021648.1 hypothetical protein FRB95_001718 [Tulasnella sp. JGI-2019a]
MVADDSESDIWRYLDHPALSAVALNQVQPYHAARLQEMIVDGPEDRRELALKVIKDLRAKDDVVLRVDEYGFGAKGNDLLELHGRAISGDWVAILTLNVAAAKDKASPAEGRANWVDSFVTFMMRELYRGHGKPYIF